MIRALRQRFIFGAMLALTILLLILVGVITVAGYVRMEVSANDMLEIMITSPNAPPPGMPARPAFGYDLPERIAPDGHYVLTVDADGRLLDVQTRGTWEGDAASLQEIAAAILSSENDSGKIAGYKFRRIAADGESRIYLLDLSARVQMLFDTLRTASLASLICLAGMFVILLPLSGRLVRSYAAYIEKQKRFITDAGHEIKTPVAIIRANIDALELIQGENKWSRNISSQTDRLSILLQQLLFMARLDEQSVSFPLESVHLSEMLREESAAYAELFREKSVDFTMEISCFRSIRANREALLQLVHILLENAAQYVNSNGKILLSLDRSVRFVRLCLSNTVAQLPDCTPDALFERFFRADTARTQSSGGCGIGLSAAQSIAQLHRGRISAEYPDDHTVRFILELPA